MSVIPEQAGVLLQLHLSFFEKKRTLCTVETVNNKNSNETQHLNGTVELDSVIKMRHLKTQLKAF